MTTPPIERRIAALESKTGAARLVLLAPHGNLTAEQQAQAEAARRTGREVLTVTIQPRAVARLEPLR